MLPAVKNAIGNLMPIFMDGGIRRGTDILKAGPLLLHPSMPCRLAAHKMLMFVRLCAPGAKILGATHRPGRGIFIVWVTLQPLEVHSALYIL